MSPKPQRDRLTYVLVAIIVLMGIEIIYLVIQNRRLSGIIGDPKKYFQTLSTDETVPSFTARDINGKDLSVRYSSSEPYRVLFWFGPTCDYCKENIAFWKRIDGDYESDHIKTLGMFAGNIAEAKEYVAEYALEFPVVCADNSYIVDVYKGHVLPQTVLIDPLGVIRGIWPGVLDEGMKETIIARLESLKPQQ
jgi:peroxiredoxin